MMGNSKIPDFLKRNDNRSYDILFMETISLSTIVKDIKIIKADMNYFRSLGDNIICIC